MQVKITATRWRPGLTAPLWSALAPWAPALAVLRLPGNEVLCFSWHTFSILSLRSAWAAALAVLRLNGSEVLYFPSRDTSAAWQSIRITIRRRCSVFCARPAARC